MTVSQGNVELFCLLTVPTSRPALRNELDAAPNVRPVSAGTVAIGLPVAHCHADCDPAANSDAGGGSSETTAPPAVRRSRLPRHHHLQPAEDNVDSACAEGMPVTSGTVCFIWERSTTFRDPDYDRNDGSSVHSHARLLGGQARRAPPWQRPCVS